MLDITSELYQGFNCEFKKRQFLLLNLVEAEEQPQNINDSIKLISVIVWYLLILYYTWNFIS